ncbi:flavin-containing monooxygenase [Sulfitobacter sabulilitoris]|uniref:NAD(P)/FAD-dependent oxidoreductase n=1 Tax=Sulfitobacter sabulilitoris TaxID=2562655 RepID=A0A5S3PIF6_9RHOB|nr:NAD(P)/FAD-dependent oxidoreductase [Sulfitobacter sabulilitoris]TMM51735.1 NAD(P)/FAD-dependent oxidoreductase [Sulfitobacter sabulilitoris]
MQKFDAIIVGAGFAGLRALYRLREMGKSVRVLEASGGIGGVWYHNGYPGARCDVESYDYSYSFSPELEKEWRWSERYATQPEILRYINHVADRFDLRKDIDLNTRMDRATYDEDTARWTIETGKGETISAQYLIMCVGQLSTTKAPEFPGQDDFAGEIIHSGVWPDREVTFEGKRVGIIGTGSSGMQMTPVVARAADHLTVFQRTANFSVPAANAPVSDEEDRKVKANYAERRQQALNSPTGLGFKPNRQSALDVDDAEREKVYEAAYHRLGFGFALAYHDILLSKPANDTAAEFLRRKIGALIDDPETRDKLVPKDHAFAARRPSVDSGYFQAFNRDNVELADIRAHPIVEFTPEGLRTEDKLHKLDMVIFATGFDAFTGSLLKPEIKGRGGMQLREKWAAGPVTQLGIGVADFPNLLIVVGPGSPSLLSNVMVSIEEQIDWMSDLVAHADAQGIVEIEAERAAEQAWVAHVNERAQETLYMTAASYYNGAEVAGKPRVFMPYSGGIRNYRRILQQCADDGYSGFALRRAPQKQARGQVGA